MDPIETAKRAWKVPGLVKDFFVPTSPPDNVPKDKPNKNGTMYLNGKKVNYYLEPHMVSMNFLDDNALRLLKEDKRNAYVMADALKKEYENYYGVPLEVDSNSIAVEILGHYYAYPYVQNPPDMGTRKHPNGEKFDITRYVFDTLATYLNAGK